MRKLFILILLVAVVLAPWAYWAAFQPVDPGGEKFVLLYPGWSARHIALTLQREGIIRSAPAFLALDYALGQAKLKAGEYKFDAPATAVEVRDRLLRGDIYARTVVVPEGYNLYDIATVVEQAGLGTDRRLRRRRKPRRIAAYTTSIHRRSHSKATCFPIPTSSAASTRRTTLRRRWCAASARRRRRLG